MGMAPDTCWLHDFPIANGSITELIHWPQGRIHGGSLSRAGLVQWAKRLGPSVALVAQEVFADQAVDGMRPVRALIRLADKYTVQRLEAACRRAVQFATPSYRSVKNILIHELDRLPQQQPAEPDNGQPKSRKSRAMRSLHQSD